MLKLKRRGKPRSLMHGHTYPRASDYSPMNMIGSHANKNLLRIRWQHNVASLLTLSCKAIQHIQNPECFS